MANPFVYNQGFADRYPPGPPTFSSHPYASPGHSPFIPPASLYPDSPYHPASPLPPEPAPLSAAARSPSWDAGFGINASGYPQYYRRERRPSWHADQGAPWATPFGLGVPTELPEVRARRHSFGHAPPPPPFGGGTPFVAPSPWVAAQVPLPTMMAQLSRLVLHPLINAETGHIPIHLDLSTSTFTPMRIIGPGGQTTFLSQEECSQPATHPPVTQMRVVCDLIPQWPIDFVLSSSRPSTPFGTPGAGATGAAPITIGDVLVLIHKTLQSRISHLDWARLSHSEETAIARAYTRRCKNAASIGHHELQQGVKRVDFLLDRFMFRGLVYAGSTNGLGSGMGWEEMKLVV